ncbi:unnamed protein product [Cylicocyclus nassatus]|uniref:Uncharacterized protein n=1 Tax=Cylicocyclus nassatus TaxID=53992 RepID=A0AA36HBU0_CYLNA|nr:unnamed protein product [Cylicocyclus nassatus]
MSHLLRVIFVLLLLCVLIQAIKQMDTCRINCDYLVNKKMRKLCMERCGILL